MQQKFILPISPGYVKHWGLWEAIRELIQNAYDQLDQNPECEVIIEHDHDHTLTISTSEGVLTPATLLLGQTTKADTGQRGQFGEGYKLAMLVLCRLGLDVRVQNGDHEWIPCIERDAGFDAEVLTIHSFDKSGDDWENRGVTFLITGVCADEWADLQLNIRPHKEDGSGILDLEPGRIYVGGLYVTTKKDFKNGYSLTPKQMKLDRDRGMVNDFDLSYVTSKMWNDYVEIGFGDVAYELIKQSAPDVSYVEVHESQRSSVSHYVARRFYEEEGADVVPVATNDEAQEAQAAGRKWKLVPKLLRSLIGKVVSLFVPTTDSPLERLKKYVKKYRFHFSGEMQMELEAIIATIEGKP